MKVFYFSRYQTAYTSFFVLKNYLRQLITLRTYKYGLTDLHVSNCNFLHTKPAEF
jgi:hypothetical protein